MRTADLRVGDRLWLSCINLPVTVASVSPGSYPGYLKITYLETNHVTEVHRDDTLVFQNNIRYL